MSPRDMTFIRYYVEYNVLLFPPYDATKKIEVKIASYIKKIMKKKHFKFKVFNKCKLNIKFIKLNIKNVIFFENKIFSILYYSL